MKNIFLNSFFKKMFQTLLVILMASSFFSCGINSKNEENGIKVVDCLDKQLVFKDTPNRVVVLQASIGSAWLLSGGSFVGIASDYSDYGLELNEAKIIGTSKQPNLEYITSLNPDLVIYSDKLAGHISVADSLSNMGFKTFAAHIDNFNDYLYCLDQFTTLTNRKDLYKENGKDIQDNINQIINKCPKEGPKVMFLRAYSSGFNVLSSGNIVCDMLKDLNTKNIAEKETSLVTELSMEIVLKENPEYIFIVHMGTSNEEKTNQYLQSSLFSSPYWGKIKAVEDGNVYTLPTDLFHFKPNDRWDESYHCLFDILYGKE